MSGCGDAPDTEGAVYRVIVEECGSPNKRRAIAAAVDNDLVVTAAHTLDQAKTVSLSAATDGGEPESDVQVAAEIVYLDLERDVAMLRLAEPAVSVLTMADPPERGSVSISSYADNGEPITKSATVSQLLDATLGGEGLRAAIRLDADIEPGDSGAPVIDEDGRLVGMVFATTQGSAVGWAISSTELVTALEVVRTSRSEPLALTC